MAAVSMVDAFRGDRVGTLSLCVVAFFVLLAVTAPLIALLHGKNPTEHYGQNEPGLVSPEGLPVLPNGGISAQYWFGIEPGFGRDVLTGLLHGIRTSLLIAFASVAAVGVVVGVTAGYLGGLADRTCTFVCNVLLAFPTLLLLLTLGPVIQTRFVGPDENEPAWMQFIVLVLVFSAFGRVPLAMVLRRRSCWNRWACPCHTSPATRTSSPAAGANASESPAPWPSGRA